MARSWMKLLDPRLAALQDRDGESLQLARALNARARYPEAAEILDRLIAERRCDAEAWFERVLSLGDRFRPEEAGELLVQMESLIVESPKDAPLQRNLGFLRLKMDDTDGAENALRRARDLDGTDAKTLELTGLLALHTDQPAEAKAWLLKALSLQPRDPRCLRLLALALDRMEDPAGAEAQLTAALDCDPDHYWSWHTLLMLLAPEAQVLSEAQALLGEFKRDTGDRDGALSYFTLASETDRESPIPWVALGDLAREDGRWTDTARCYQEALARDPAAADIHVQLGYTLLELQRHREGEQAFLRALEEDPSEYSAYLGLAEVCRQEGRPEDQARMVQEAMSLAPEDPDVWNAKGVVLEMQTRLEDATSAYERALRIDASHRQAANNLGFVLEKRMAAGEPGLESRTREAWKRRLLICRDEGQSLRMAVEHLDRLGVDESIVRRWLNQEILEDALDR